MSTQLPSSSNLQFQLSKSTLHQGLQVSTCVATMSATGWHDMRLAWTEVNNDENSAFAACVWLV